MHSFALLRLSMLKFEVAQLGKVLSRDLLPLVISAFIHPKAVDPVMLSFIEKQLLEAWNSCRVFILIIIVQGPLMGQEEIFFSGRKLVELKLFGAFLPAVVYKYVL
jgi:hypothetical protein